MHQVSLETICPLKAFQLHYCPAKNAKSMVKHFIFLHKFSVISKDLCLFIPRKCHFTSALLEPIDLGRVDWKKTVSVSNSPILTLSRELLWCELLSLNAYGIFLSPSQYFVIESSHLCWSLSVICLLRYTFFCVSKHHIILGSQDTITSKDLKDTLNKSQRTWTYEKVWASILGTASQRWAHGCLW